ncbi:hypothetical protein [Mixta gaviniae]|nr:hypothetical protein [Mixta gaviniae]
MNNYYLSVNGNVVIPVREIEKSINTNTVMDVDIQNENDELIATLCLMNLDHQENVYSLSKNRLFAFFYDSILAGTCEANHQFSSHYVVIEPEHYEYYLSIMNTSELWGGYTHKEKPVGKVRTIGNIKIKQNYQYPSLNHNESMVMAIYSLSTFERYLKYYHQLELLFDAVRISKLKAINTNDLKGYADALKICSKGNEISHLEYIIKNYVTSFDEIIESMSLIINYEALAKDMFQGYSKEGNPLSDEARWSVNIKHLNENNYNPATLATSVQHQGSTVRLINKNDIGLFNDFLVKVISYWIYRIRCSIAHNRISEYVFSYSDEGFISEFGERLLLSVIKSVLSNAGLHQEMSILSQT